jgi:hypothetical protein
MMIRRAVGAEVLRIPNEAACRRVVADAVVSLITGKGTIWRDRLQEQIYRILLRADLPWADEYVLQRQKLDAKYGPDETDLIVAAVRPRRMSKNLRKRKSKGKKRKAKKSSTQEGKALARVRARLDPGPLPTFDEHAARARRRLAEEHRRRGRRRAKPKPVRELHSCHRGVG